MLWDALFWKHRLLFIGFQTIVYFFADNFKCQLPTGLCFSNTSAASDEPDIVQRNATVNEPFSLSCHVPDNGAFRWKRFLKLQNRRENLYDSKDKRFLKNDTNFTAFSNGTIMFQCANLSDTGEYHCVVEEGTSNLIETKYYVHVQSKIVMMFYFLRYINDIFR